MPKNLIKIIGVFIVLINTVFAQQLPPTPQNLVVEQYITPNPNGNVSAYLHWEMPANSFYNYKIYRAVDSSEFTERGNSHHIYFYDWETPFEHTYSYYVKAVGPNGVLSEASNTVQFTPVTPPPPPIGTISGTVTIDDGTALPIAKAKVRLYRGNSNWSAREVLTDSLGNFSVNVDTGNYFIQTKKEGFVSEWFDNKLERNVADVVSVAENSSIVLSVALALVPPPPIGIIGGMVVDDITLNPIANAKIHFYAENSGHSTKHVKTDSSGIYFAELPPGNYVIKASKDGYNGEYFDNKVERSQADIVVVADDSTSTATFALTAIAPPTMYNFSGTITDSTGTSIAGAKVVILRSGGHFRRAHRYLGENIISGEDYFLNGHGKLRGVAWKGETDENGNYTASLVGGKAYIVFAKKTGYFSEYYNDKPTPQDADKITLVSDTTGINFVLTLNPEVQNGVNGVVKDETGIGVLSNVVLVKLSTNGRSKCVKHTVTDSLGKYSFANIYSGNYFVKAIPHSTYAPSWYDAVNCGTYEWQNADTVNITGYISGIDICVIPQNDSGFSKISGTIDDIQNTKLNGVTVFAINISDNSIAGYDITEMNGYYSIDNLQSGEYKVVVDFADYVQESTPTISIGFANQYQSNNTNVKLIPTSPLGVSDETSVPKTFALHQNYPNPFNPKSTIKYEIAKNGFVSLKVYDIIGNEVATIVNQNQNAGIYEIYFDASDLNSGIYFYKLTTNNFSEIKKMILVK